MRVEKTDELDAVLLTNDKRKLMQGSKDDSRGYGFRKQISPIFSLGLAQELGNE